jgi:hypothetical protein
MQRCETLPVAPCSDLFQVPSHILRNATDPSHSAQLVVGKDAACDDLISNRRFGVHVAANRSMVIKEGLDNSAGF